MASTKQYLDFILDQLSMLEGITYKAMMGEYILYYRGKIVGGIYDDRFLVKPVKAAKDMMPGAEWEIPYDGAREMLLVDDVDNREFLKELLEAMDDELPAPKKKGLKKEPIRRIARQASESQKSQLKTITINKKRSGGKMETERLILRHWKESDAEDLFAYASDPDVGPIAGWPPHQSVDESREVIKNVLNGEESYAICLKEDNRAIGSIELKLNGRTDFTDRDDECELGFCLAKPFWGQGIVPEAVREMLRHAFEDCGMRKVWIAYYEGNTRSKRVQEKCGFRFQWRSEDVDVPLMHEKRTGYVSLMTKEDWESGQ